MVNEDYRRQGLWVASPGDQLLRGDKVDIGQGKNGVDELEEALLAVGPVEEPGRVEEEGEGRLALGVVLQEVLGEDLLDGVGVLGVETAVRHGAGPAPVQNVAFRGFFSDHEKTQMRTVTKKASERTSPIVERFALCVSVLLSALCQCVAFSGSIFTGLAGSKLLLIRLNLLLPRKVSI